MLKDQRATDPKEENGGTEKEKSEDPKKKNFSQETGLQMCYPT
jgi:hypothetical protein